MQLHTHRDNTAQGRDTLTDTRTRPARVHAHWPAPDVIAALAPAPTKPARTAAASRVDDLRHIATRINRMFGLRVVGGEAFEHRHARSSA